MIKLTTDLRETVIAIAQDAAAAIMAVYATPSMSRSNPTAAR